MEKQQQQATTITVRVNDHDKKIIELIKEHYGVASDIGKSTPVVINRIRDKRHFFVFCMNE